MLTPFLPTSTDLNNLSNAAVGQRKLLISDEKEARTKYPAEGNISDRPILAEATTELSKISTTKMINLRQSGSSNIDGCQFKDAKLRVGSIISMSWPHFGLAS